MKPRSMRESARLRAGGAPHLKPFDALTIPDMSGIFAIDEARIERQSNKKLAAAIWRQTVDSESFQTRDVWRSIPTWVDVPITNFLTVLDDPDGLATLDNTDAKGGA